LLDFITSGLQCRSIQLLRYFGDKSTRRCGICDICRKQGKTELNDVEIELITEKIRMFMGNERKHLYSIVAGLDDIEEDKVLSVIQWLLDNERLRRQKDETLIWSRQLDIDLE
jgi:ATP-dependent DNA helicase RecQ